MTSKQKFRLRYLDKYMEFLKLLLPAFTLYLSRSPKTQEVFDKAIVYLKRNEKTLHPVLDVRVAASVLQRRAIEIKQLHEGQLIPSQASDPVT